MKGFLNEPWMFKFAEYLVSSKCISTGWRIIAPCFISCYSHLGLIIFIATWGSSYLLPLGVPYLVTVPGVVKFYTGINIIRVRKRAVLRTFLFIKIASLQIESVLQNTIKKPLQWPGASVYRFILCLTAFVLIIWSERKLTFDFILILFFFFFFFLFKS